MLNVDKVEDCCLSDRRCVKGMRLGRVKGCGDGGCNPEQVE